MHKYFCEILLKSREYKSSFTTLFTMKKTITVYKVKVSDWALNKCLKGKTKRKHIVNGTKEKWKN